MSLPRRIFLVDDHPLVREWLTTLIEQQEDLVVCGEAGDAPQALQSIERLRPDVVIVDITLPSGSGLELVKDIRCVSPESIPLMLSMHDELTYCERALRAGARGYVSKRDTTRKIITAIREVLQGRLFVSDELRTLMAEKFVSGSAPVSDVRQLSDRELEVFRMLGEGRETREIAETLGLSIKTVQVYCARIKEKFGLANGTELLREAIRWWDAGGSRR
ncbi:MAG: response regulator transcription factor [Verrucomicrobiae bacterium]|nr:response regulator transcription factor [Verrucomicrobiae bacterium]